MELALVAIPVGLVVLVWGAGRFVEGAASVAGGLGLPPLLIGMLVVGFGTSTPELVVSAMASAQGSTPVAIGNAVGSNIANIGLILGVTAVLAPVAVTSRVLRTEMPLLLGVSGLAMALLWDGSLSRTDATVLAVGFVALVWWTVRTGLASREDPLGTEAERELLAPRMPTRPAVVRLVVGLLALLGASRLLVWGATTVADRLGVDDVLIGLTVVAVGTSLPEMASAVVAARRGEGDLALGNVLGSNLFNTLAVIGLSGLISPTSAMTGSLRADLVVMGALTVVLVVMGVGLRGPGRVNRWEGAALVVAYAGYVGWLVAART